MEATRTFSVYLSKATFPPVFLTLGLISFLFLRIGTSSIEWIILGLIICLVPVAGMIGLLQRFTNVSTHNREDRRFMYIGTFLLLTAFLFVSYFLGAPPAFTSLNIVLLATTLVFGVFNQLLKVSIHTGSTAALSGLYSSINPGMGAGLMALSIAVGLSRLKLGRHTRREVILGMILGLCAGLTAFLF